MKAELHLAALVALATIGLAFQAESQATDLARQPLNAATLARPSVLFAMDDSGSMDAEVLIDGANQGWVYGNTKDANLHPNGKRRDGWADGDSAMYYLFPNGQGTGNRVYGDSDRAGLAVPPTPQMAWTRSSDYNPIYYNPDKVYAPWSPAYVNGVTQTFANADPAAARSHPLLGSSTFTLNATLLSSTANWLFTFTAGMVIPSDATSITCANGNVGALPYTVTVGNSACKAAVPYYPASYWKKETCTVNGSTCVTNYDGATLGLHEIKAANYASPAAYTAAMQNFANWFSYHRKRRLLLAAAMGGVLENLTGVRMGVVAFNAQAVPTMYDADLPLASANGLSVAAPFYLNEGKSSTPTHGTFAYVRDQFDTNTNVIQYACQRNAAFIITDGFANDSGVSPPNYNQTTYGKGSPYQDISASSLADQALAYFTLQLRTDLPAGRVPRGSQNVANPDSNTNLHLNTYALTLGTKGTLWPNSVSPFSVAPVWPKPVSNDPSMIDDLWHATINGRGQMYLATDTESTSRGLQAALAEIKGDAGAQSAVAVGSVHLSDTGSLAYLAGFNPSNWTGDLSANGLNATTGDLDPVATWSAAALLAARPWSTRLIVTADGNSGASTGMGFTLGNLGGTVNPDPGRFSNASVINYLRGDRSGEGSTFRPRAGLLGAVINAEPVVDATNNMVYLASGEGMLHAISTTTGAEQWAFVPQGVLGSIGATVQRGYVFKTQLDATPVIGRYTDGGAKLLVGGLGAAGRSYYALDVTQPNVLTESDAAAQVKWTFPSITQVAQRAQMGFAMGKPVIVKTATQGHVVLVTSGYDGGTTTGDGKGRLWMLDANTGAVLSEFVTTAGSNAAEAGLAQVAAYREDDNTVQFVYAGDLLGNMWKFDLAAGTTTLLATLKDGQGNAQPVTTTPLLTRINNKRIVMVGTGRLLDISDFGGSSVQSFYAITDGAALANARTALTPLAIDNVSKLISGKVDWTTSRGWYFDLPASQLVNTDPSLVLGRVFFSANVTGGTNCAQSSYGYIVDVLSGSGESAVLSSSVNATRPMLVQSGDRLYRLTRFGDGSVDKRDVTANPGIASRKNAWKLIAR